ncbi:hypothetical protein CHU94_08340 [Rhodoferax sp. TH121]|nr:hypothetical protein CHU94_08340 [Rhodoferax sp. TH121]
MVIENQGFAATRADINAALAALATNSSGATEPATKYAYQLWADTTADRLKVRNAANDAWVSVLVLSTGAPVSGVSAGPITTSGLTQATARMLGRSTAGTGAVEEISVGAKLALTGGVLNLADTVQSMVRLDTQNGNGSTNVCSPRFTNVRANTGDVTYADSASLGPTFTIGVSDKYDISFTYSAGGSEGFGLTINENPSTHAGIIALVARAEILQMSDTPAANVAACVSWSGYLPAGTVIRARTSGGTSTGSRFMFTISNRK